MCCHLMMNRQHVRVALLGFVLTISCACVEGENPADERAATTPAVQQPVAASRAATLPEVHLAPAFPKLTFQRPVFFTHSGDGTNRVFVIEQAGRILTFENRNDVVETQVFLDIKSKVRTRHNEEGLLSLGFHPKFKENGQFFVYYSVSDPKRNRISRYSVLHDNPSRADPASEQIVLEVEQPYGNHNGSTLLFGPDGFLYASFGDGGLAADPHRNGQNLATLLGSIIRIDVNAQEGGRNYAIPNDNPFVNREGARPEIWAYGLRNVWRMSFDRETGELWAGDVGQDKWEEIDLIVKGGNYGWNIRESAHPFAQGSSSDPLIDPVVEYSHRDGISVTGGYVYRGKRSSRLQGVYLYADYGSKTIWGVRYENGKVTAHRKLLSGGESAHITSFGEDSDGELYICAFDRYDGGKGKVYRISD